MADGIAYEFFDAQDKDSKVKNEEDRLLAHITKARPVKEAETIAYLNEPPKHGQGFQAHLGKEIILQWRDQGGTTIKQIKLHTDKLLRLPLQQVVDAWQIKNIKLVDGGIDMKVMMDGYSDLPLRDKEASVIGIWADALTPEEVEAEKKAQASRNRKGSFGATAVPARKLSGALGQPTSAQPSAPQRKVSNPHPRTSPPGAENPPRKLSNPPPSVVIAPPVAGKTSGNTTPRSEVVQDPNWKLSEEDRKKKEQAEEDLMWQKIAGRQRKNSSTTS